MRAKAKGEAKGERNEEKTVLYMLTAINAQ